MARTNIDIDDDLVARAMALYGLGTKRSAVELALRRLVGDPMTRDEALGMEGAGFDYSNDEVEAMSTPAARGRS